MSQPALDKLILIADTFDRGVFAGMDRVDTDTVARAVGLPSKAVSRFLKRLEVNKLSEAKTIPQRHDRVYEYPPRIRLPDTNRMRHAEARLVVEAIADHRLPRSFTTRLLYNRLGIPEDGYTIGVKGHLPKSLHEALLRVGFKSYRPKGFKDKGIWKPATWEPPLDNEAWPKLFLEQRRLRRDGLKASTVYKHTDSAAKLDGIIRDAMRELDLSSIPYDEKGELKAHIHRVIRRGYLALVASENAAAQADREPAKVEVDWRAVGALSERQLREFARIAAIKSESEINPGAFALRWVKENEEAREQAAVGATR